MRWTVALMVVATVGCGKSTTPPRQGTSIPTYDPKTGKLIKLEADLNHNGKIETWTYMDGARPIRTEQDRNEDGKIDRWEFLDDSGHMAKAMASSKGDPNKIDRWETYEEGVLVLVEEDTNGDGRPDKWEKHRGMPITSVEFDLNFDGVPDQRLTYGPNAELQWIESQPDGRGGYLKKLKPVK